MKKIYYICIMLFIACTTQFVGAQIGNLIGINYQAVAIDENGKEIVGMDIEGKPLYNKTIGVRFTISTGSAGPILFQETHTVNTDQYGLFSLVIGLGTNTGSGAHTILMTMPWIDADQWLGVEIATKNDGNYKLVSLQQFMSVPYSFYTDNIADSSIYSVKIVDSTIINIDIATGAVDSRTILNETILAEDIDTGAVTTSEILNETILAEDIGTGSVETSEILNETILAEDIGTGSVETSEILNETILAEDIGIGSVETSEILNETILAEDIGTGSVETSEILNETILAEDIGTGSVETSEILNETILAEDIGTGSVETSEILDLTILTADISNASITQPKIKTKAITVLGDASVTLSATQMIDNTIFTILTASVDRTLTTATAVLLVAGMPGAQVGSWFEFTIVPPVVGISTITLAAGTGVTISGVNFSNNRSMTYIALFTNVITPAVTIIRK